LRDVAITNEITSTTGRTKTVRKQMSKKNDERTRRCPMKCFAIEADNLKGLSPKN